MYSHGGNGNGNGPPLDQNGIVHQNQQQSGSASNYGGMGSPQFFNEREPPMDSATPAPPLKGKQKIVTVNTVTDNNIISTAVPGNKN